MKGCPARWWRLLQWRGRKTSPDVPLRGIVEHGANNYLCEVRASASLADVMLRFADLRLKGRLAMGESAHRKVQGRFSEERLVDTYLEVLDCLNKARSGV